MFIWYILRERIDVHAQRGCLLFIISLGGRHMKKNKVLFIAPGHGNGGIRSWAKKLLQSFNNDEYVGVWKYKIEDLENDGDYAHDEETGMFGLYFKEGNPGEYFEEIEYDIDEIIKEQNEQLDKMFKDKDNLKRLV